MKSSQQLLAASTAALVAAGLWAFLRRGSARSTAVSIPPTMRAVVAKEGKCVLVQHPTPSPQANEVLIQVRTTAINRLDIGQRVGKVPVPKDVTEILGLEAAGIVVAIGSEVGGAFRVGDEVLALVPGGGYAEYVTVHHATVMHKPKDLPWEAAGSVPEAWLTAFKLVHVVGQARSGDRVAIHAAASGVGVAAIQLVKAAGAHAFVTVGSSEKLKLCVERLGAAAGALRHDGPWIDKLKALDGPPFQRAVDLVLDPVASSYAEQNVEALAIDGRWVLYSTLSGPSLPPDFGKTFLGALAKKRLSLLATTLRARPIPYKADLVRRFSRDVLPKLSLGGKGDADQFVHIIDKTFVGLESAQAAHEYMETNANLGKIVLTV